MSISISPSMEEAIVLYPSPAMGHIVAMVELGKLILTHKPSLSINILVTPPLFKSSASNDINTYITNISTTTPSITFHHLRAISPSPPPVTTPSSCPVVMLMFEHLISYNPSVHQTLVSISKTHTIQALIIDFFCTPSFAIATKLNVPTYYFMTSGISILAAFTFFPIVHQNTSENLKDMKSNLDIPGFSQPVSCIDMPEAFLERNDKAYEHFLDFCNQIPKSSGVIVNSFETLEPKALKALSDGLCLPDSTVAAMPPVFCIGPLIASDNGGGGGDGETHTCMAWLDMQPSKTVVFLCFGSLGFFSPEQLKEIATGLEESMQRFLWVVRDPDLDPLFPNGFLDRVKGRGLVVTKWAPQVAILNHDSIGGFVTHCGWNSTLEAILAGVPMIAWPLYAEQKLNRVLLVEELKIALPIKEADDRFVTADEVKMRVCQLMDACEGVDVRKNVVARKDEAIIATTMGGSSRVSLAKFLESLKENGGNKE